MLDKILKLREEDKTDTEIGKELGISRQKVGAIVKKAEFDKDNKVVEDEFPAEMYAKESNVIKDDAMGGCVIMTAREYHEYSEANGRYQGRREGKKGKLDPMELRVEISTIARGDRSGVDVKNHLMNKHGITEDDIRTAAKKLTLEEEVDYRTVLKPLGMK